MFNVRVVESKCNKKKKKKEIEKLENCTRLNFYIHSRLIIRVRTEIGRRYTIIWIYFHGSSKFKPRDLCQKVSFIF